MSNPLSHKILVVEDDPKISDLLLNYLHANGYEGTAYYDGLKALQYVKEQHPMPSSWTGCFLV